MLRLLVLQFGYFLIAVLAGPVYALRAWFRGNRELAVRQRFGWVTPRPGTGPCLWIHAVSVGEVLSAREFVRLAREARPDMDVVMPTVTPTGNAVAKQHFPDCQVIYFPIDFAGAVRRTLTRIRPDVVVLVELEIWPGFINACRKRNIPVTIINVRMTEASYDAYRWRFMRWLMGPELTRIEAASAQNTVYANRLIELGMRRDRLTVTGNMKFDLMPAPERLPSIDVLAKRLSIRPEHFVFVAGSIHAKYKGRGISEYDACAEVALRMSQKHPDFVTILVPRKLETLSELEMELSRRGLSWIRKTELDRDPEMVIDASQTVVLVDTMGELSTLYHIASAAYVGGSLVPVGGHNILEPAMFGRPVITGPITFNFADSVELLGIAGVLTVVRNEDELEAVLSRWMEDPAERERIASRARGVIDANRGASARNWGIVEGVLARRQLPASSDPNPSGNQPV
jgi:3-deoxy-D-manno-octulosonic-acid transferase